VEPVPDRTVEPVPDRTVEPVPAVPVPASGLAARTRGSHVDY
jgi:hypothetical protein